MFFFYQQGCQEGTEDAYKDVDELVMTVVANCLLTLFPFGCFIVMIFQNEGGVFQRAYHTCIMTQRQRLSLWKTCRSYNIMMFLFKRV